ncbi:MAG: flavodoxin family protein [Chlorobi bacterium]|nr:flavodoxin family protein [Chlorobiota bacterium]
MKALIFDGSPEGDPSGGRIAGELVPILEAKGYETEHIILREKSIGNCNGCFGCWLKTPGICGIDDDNRELSEKFVQSDLLIMLTPVTFGGYSPELKRMLDHFIANVSPFFTTIDGESHHRKRYAAYPDLLAIGWLDQPDDRQTAIFRYLVMRNSINFYSAKAGCGVICRTEGTEAIRQTLAELLRGLETGSQVRMELPDAGTASGMDDPPRKALLLVGSPRMEKSSSASIGGYLLEELETRGVATQTVHIHKAVRDKRRLAGLLEAVDSADLCILAFPLYIDSVPAPVLSVMKQIKERRNAGPSGAGLAVIVNCGFIESHHNETAIAIGAEFAAESGFTWMGGISIGGGEGLVHGRPLRSLGGPAIPCKKSLDLAAAALAEGKPLPEDARRQLARPFVPGWLYRFVGSLNWKKEARRNGISRRLGDQPYRQLQS